MRREPGGKVFGGGDQHVPAGRKEAEKVKCAFLVLK